MQWTSCIKVLPEGKSQMIINFSHCGSRRAETEVNARDTRTHIGRANQLWFERLVRQLLYSARNHAHACCVTIPLSSILLPLARSSVPRACSTVASESRRHEKFVLYTHKFRPVRNSVVESIEIWWPCSRSSSVYVCVLFFLLKKYEVNFLTVNEYRLYSLWFLIVVVCPWNCYNFNSKCTNGCTRLIKIFGKILSRQLSFICR